MIIVANEVCDLTKNTTHVFLKIYPIGSPYQAGMTVVRAQPKKTVYLNEQSNGNRIQLTILIMNQEYLYCVLKVTKMKHIIP